MRNATKAGATDPDHHSSAGWGTRAVHAGGQPSRPDFTPTSTPIYASSAFFYDDTATLDAVFGNERPGFVYSRYGNPTVEAFEQAVADLEGTEAAVAFGSGMGAMFASIMLDAHAGDRVIAAPDLYGATYAILAKMAPAMGIDAAFVDFRDATELERVITEIRPSLVICESISNPLMRMVDISVVSRIAHAAGAKLLVDNTFASPILINPVALGADSVVHSATKFLGGHGDATGGVVGTTAERASALREISKLTGAVLSPFEAWLIGRGIKTLPLRVRQQSVNAGEIAAWLNRDTRVAHVNYPGLNGEPVPAGLFNDEQRGAMISFDIRNGDKAAVFCFMEALQLAKPATTLGDVWTLVLYPAISSHRALSEEKRAEIGIGDGLVRLSVGIEDAADIIADLDQALAAAVSHD